MMDHQGQPLPTFYDVLLKSWKWILIGLIGHGADCEGGIGENPIDHGVVLLNVLCVVMNDAQRIRPQITKAQMLNQVNGLPNVWR